MQPSEVNSIYETRDKLLEDKVHMGVARRVTDTPDF